jgi:ethanolamine utilization cobalamin adenosyltransferase
MPQASDGEVIALLNRLRCAVRETEVAAVSAFQDAGGTVSRVDILQSLNRMSSMLYLLMIQQKSHKGNGI